MLQIATLGGYLARTHDPPPGNMVVWRGLTRLHDLAIGITIGNSATANDVGNCKLRRRRTMRPTTGHMQESIRTLNGCTPAVTVADTALADSGSA